MKMGNIDITLKGFSDLRKYKYSLVCLSYTLFFMVNRMNIKI